MTAPIIGSTKVEHLEDAAHALEIELSPEVMEQLMAPYEPHPVKGHTQPSVWEEV